jgi:DNA-directed RNA polymerase subunit beta'
LVSFSSNLGEISSFLDDLKDIGFKFSTISGLTISLFDIPELETKKENFSKSHEKILKIDQYKEKGFYTDQESYEKKIEV